MNVDKLIHVLMLKLHLDCWVVLFIREMNKLVRTGQMDDGLTFLHGITEFIIKSST